MRPLDPRLLPHLRPARGPLVGVLTGSVAAGGLVVAQAFAVAGLVVALVDGHPDAVRWSAALVAVVTAGRALAGWLVDLCSAWASATVTTALRRRIITAALSLGGLGLSRRRSGELAVLGTRGVAAVDPYLTRYVPSLALAAVLPVLTVLAIASQDLLSAGVVIATLPLVPVFAVLVGVATRDRADSQWRALSLLSGHFVDVMRGLPTLVAYRRAAAQSSSIRRITDRYRRATNDTLRLAFASSAILELVATISVALVAVEVGLRLAGGSLDLGTGLVVLLLAPEAYWPLRRVGAEFHAAAEGTATFEAADRLLSETAPQVEPDDAVEPAPVVEPDAVVEPIPVVEPVETPDIRLEGVTTGYAGRPLPVLDGVRGYITGRGLTAVTGPSGAGKSTLLAVLTGDLPPWSGRVTVDGADLASLDPDAWRSCVAWLPQRPWFLPGSIRDNVRLGRPSATDEEVWHALERVALADLVATLPGGLDQQVGEDGLGLSAGERARLALARVVLAGRPLVLLDEPTAHLDPVTEEVIARTLTWLAGRSAVVVVAHRERLVRQADRVIEIPASSGGAAAPAASATPAAESAHRAGGRADTAEPSQDASTDGAPHPRTGARLWAGALLGAAAAAAGVALTATAGWLIARAAEQPPILTLMVAIVGVRLFGLARPVLRYAERLVSHDVALRLLAERRARVYDALVPLVPGRIGRHRGDVLASVVDDVDALVDRYLRVRAPVATYLLVSAGAAGFAAWVLPAAGLVTLCMLAAGGVAAYGVSTAGVARAERAFVVARGRLSSLVVQTLQGAPELIAWQATGRALDDIDVASRAAAGASTRSALAVATGRALAVLAAGAGMVAMGWAGAAGLAAHAVSRPMVALLVLLPVALLEVVSPLADAGALRVRTRAADARLATLSRTQPAVADPPRPVALDPVDGTVRLDHVSAGWGAADVVRGVSLGLGPGRRLGMVGPSGCGKSTLAAVLLRFLDPTSGQVRLGARDARDLLLDDVRRTVGLVDDDPHVFSSTLRENVRLARPEASEADLEGALRTARLGSWLDGLPEGMDTLLGDGNAHVSGGERARIGLARAVLAGQPVLVLDEPTAHLDTATANAVADDLLAAGGGRAVLWITHRTVGLDRMDAVLDLGTSYEPGVVRPR